MVKFYYFADKMTYLYANEFMLIKRYAGLRGMDVLLCIFKAGFYFWYTNANPEKQTTQFSFKLHFTNLLLYLA